MGKKPIAALITLGVAGTIAAYQVYQSRQAHTCAYPPAEAAHHFAAQKGADEPACSRRPGTGAGNHAAGFDFEREPEVATHRFDPEADTSVQRFLDELTAGGFPSYNNEAGFRGLEDEVGDYLITHRDDFENYFRSHVRSDYRFNRDPLLTCMLIRSVVRHHPEPNRLVAELIVFQTPDAGFVAGLYEREDLSAPRFTRSYEAVEEALGPVFVRQKEQGVLAGDSGGRYCPLES